MTVYLTLQNFFTDTFSLNEAQETLQNTYFCRMSLCGGFTLTEALGVLHLPLLLANCVQTPGHTKAVQAITHHGLS